MVLQQCFVSPVVGNYIDVGNRLKVVRLSIGAYTKRQEGSQPDSYLVLQRSAVAVSCILLWLLVRFNRSSVTTKYALLAAVAILACIEKLCSIMNLISVERDWVVVVAGDCEAPLRSMNSQMRRIDLVCKLVGPFVISILDGFSTKLAIEVNFGMNVASILVEYYAIKKVGHP